MCVCHVIFCPLKANSCVSSACQSVNQNAHDKGTPPNWQKGKQVRQETITGGGVRHVAERFNYAMDNLQRSKFACL